jgi:hypothetical protein
MLERERLISPAIAAGAWPAIVAGMLLKGCLAGRAPTRKRRVPIDRL